MGEVCDLEEKDEHMESGLQPAAMYVNQEEAPALKVVPILVEVRGVDYYVGPTNQKQILHQVNASFR